MNIYKKKIQINNNWGMHKIECNNDGLEVKITHDGPYQKYLHNT